MVFKYRLCPNLDHNLRNLRTKNYAKPNFSIRFGAKKIYLTQALTSRLFHTNALHNRRL